MYIRRRGGTKVSSKEYQMRKRFAERIIFKGLWAVYTVKSDVCIPGSWMNSCIEGQ